MQNYCYFWVAVVCWCSFTTTPSHASTANNSQQECHLSVGVAEWPPYQSFLGEQAKGIQIDLIRQIAKHANCSLNIINKRYYQSLKAVEKGTIDFTLNATETEARKKFGIFSIPYRKEILVLYAKSEFRDQCNSSSLESLLESGFKLGLQKDMIYGQKLTAIQQTPRLNYKIKYFEHTGQDIAFVQENDLDGIVEDPVMVAYKARQSPSSDRLYSCQVSVSSSPVSLLFSKKTVSPEIVERFNQAIELVRHSKEYQKYWKW